MGKKALFFDIDGTIWDFHNRICESTVEAMKKLHDNGHLTFICSGRSRAYIRNEVLLALGFDGIISGCGTMIEYDNKQVFYKKLDDEFVRYTIDGVRKYGFRPILEGREYLYMDDEDFAGDLYGNKLKKELGSHLIPIKGQKEYDIAKLSCAVTGNNVDKCEEEFGKYFEFILHNEHIVEMVPKGFSKGTGILKVCEMIGIDINDTYAFGDSNNDISMLKTVGHAIVMGNGTEEAKKEADYITTTVMEDGIWNACRYFNLI